MLFGIFSVGVLVVIILVMLSVINRSCDNNLNEANLGALITEIVSYLPTLYFGLDILKKIT